MKSLNLITFILIVVGTMTTAVLGLSGVNLVGTIFGGVDMVAKLVYFLIGLAGIHYLITNVKTHTS